MYPSRYRLPEMTAHVVAALERRREGYKEWNAETEAGLTAEATEALEQAGKQFAEVADDKRYWAQLTDTVLTVALPRYFLLAKAEQEAARNGHGVWRGGDFVSRAAYAIGGLVVGAILWRTGLPKWLELLPVAFFIGGPFIPDFQLGLARRAYKKKLEELYASMGAEAAAQGKYRPMEELGPAAVDEQAGQAAGNRGANKTSEGG